jgi:hypothetical protein
VRIDRAAVPNSVQPRTVGFSAICPTNACTCGARSSGNAAVVQTAALTVRRSNAAVALSVAALMRFAPEQLSSRYLTRRDRHSAEHLGETIMAGIFNFQRRGNLAGMAALVMLGMSSLASPAKAALLSNFTVDISPSARVLDALADLRDGDISQAMFNEIKYDEACDNPHLRIRARNKPGLMITNLDASNLTQFSLSIDSGLPYIFGQGDVGGDGFLTFIRDSFYTDPGVTITSASVDNAANPKTLTVNFDGLSQNKKAIFNVDLDTNDANGFVYPDYRMVLFGTPEEEGGTPTTPATALVKFANGVMSPTLLFGQACDLEGQIAVNTPQYADPPYAEANIRPYNNMDKIEVATLGAIPEPNAAFLAIAGLAALVTCSRKERRVA